MSTDIVSVAVFAADGSFVAGGPGTFESASAPVDRLWGASVVHARAFGDAPLDHVVVPGRNGCVAVVSSSGRRIVALTGPRPAVGLLLFDLRTCLSDAYAGEEDSP